MKRLAQPRRDRHRLARRPIDEDVDEVAVRGRQRIALAEDRDRVGDGAVAELVHAHAGQDARRVRERRVVLATRLDDEPDRVAARRIEAALADQALVHGRVEEAVVRDVVDVAVDVVVAPARRDRRLEWVVVEVGGVLSAWAHQ